jgi:hypothetical protein
MQLSDLQERHHRLTLQVGHLEYELVRDDDEPQQHCLEAMDPPETNYQSTPNYPAKPDSSLVERVVRAVGNEPFDSRSESRAAIREVAAWLREEGYPSSPGRLEKEAERG